MKRWFILISFLLAVVLIIMPIAGASDNKITRSASPTQADTRTLETPAKVTSTPGQTPRVSSGEVEVPATTRVTPTPTVPRTTESATRTVPPTTIPVITVTGLVYPSGPVYQPVYYYPPGYPYSINSYYPTGSLTVTSNPSGAIVGLDGSNSGTTPYIFTGLTTGYHSVEVDYPGYEAYVTSVYIDSGVSQEVNADLTSLVTPGSLFIDSTPKGADVYVDGNYQGTSPVTVSALSAGSHRVELHLAGYEVLTSTEKVAAGQGTVVNLILIPHSSLSNTGSIDITSTMPGALVYLDGTYKGSSQSGKTFSVISVSPGSHTLLLHLPGYTDFTQTVQVNAGQISNVNAAFVASPASLQSPAASSQASGSVIVTSTPAGGEVYLDNQFRGIAPVTIYNVAPGTHIVNLKLSGYSDWSTSVDVPVNQMVQVPAIFVPGNGTAPLPTHTPLSPVTILGSLAIGTVIISYRVPK